jgi:bifunctional DNase/RNase
MSDETTPEETIDDAVPATDAPDAPEPEVAAPLYRVLSPESVTFDLADASPQVHLMEAEMPFRNLSIPVALPEAQALYLALQGESGRRPGTHELFAEVLRRTRTDVVAARIVRCEGGVFYAELDLMTPRGREVVDCRTSDAIILALRQRVPAPILCNDEVLAQFYL